MSELWINNKFDDSSAKDTIYTDKVKFVPSDDPEEHQGIMLIYKNETL